MVMTDEVMFPVFKPVELEDRHVLKPLLEAYKPTTSELTFTNLFIWRSHYNFHWSLYKDWVLIISLGTELGSFALEPVGPPPRKAVARLLLDWMAEERQEKKPRIERADERLVAELEGVKEIIIEETRDHFDYVYRTEDLVHLVGGRYRSKRNHINQLLRAYSIRYSPLTGEHIEDCLSLQDRWCVMKRCEDDLDLLGEWDAVREILSAYEILDLNGGVITIHDKVMAFTVGQMLNDETAVIHIEKADPEIPGLYAAINQQFCENQWKTVPYINREQDLGMPGLREAKLSYYPDHLVKKFRLVLKVE